MERNYIKEKKAAVKEFDDKKVELKENLIAELEEKKKMIENEKLTMELTGGKRTRRHCVSQLKCLSAKKKKYIMYKRWISVILRLHGGETYYDP